MVDRLGHVQRPYGAIGKLLSRHKKTLFVLTPVCNVLIGLPTSAIPRR